MAAAFESPSSDSAWSEFCERHAIAAAQDFSKSCLQYLSLSIPEGSRGALSHKDFLKKYLETFAEHFEVDFCKRRLNTSKPVNGVSRHSEDLSDCNSDVEDGSPKLQHKPFFRR